VNFRQHFPEIATATSSGGSNSGDTTLGDTTIDALSREVYVYFGFPLARGNKTLRENNT
jgi:hypothetical protein